MERYNFGLATAAADAVQPEKSQTFEEQVKGLQEDIIGNDAVCVTPFGIRRVVYADYTASGRGLKSVERFMADRVLPFYANTHTLASNNGRQSSEYVAEARQMVKARSQPPAILDTLERTAYHSTVPR